MSGAVMYKDYVEVSPYLPEAVTDRFAARPAADYYIDHFLKFVFIY
jgi:hypothetical protein